MKKFKFYITLKNLKDITNNLLKTPKKHYMLFILIVFLELVTINIDIGMLSTVNSAADPISQMTMLVSRFIFHVPFLGLVLRFWGAEAVNKENMVKLMKQ